MKRHGERQVDMSAEDQVGAGLGPAPHGMLMAAQPVAQVIGERDGDRLVRDDDAHLALRSAREPVGDALDLLGRNLPVPVPIAARRVQREDEQAFGFEKHTAVSDSDGAVIYGQMTYRGGLMMMGAVRDTDLDKLMCQPDEVGGAETQSCYIVVDDADAHYARAREAGADVVLEIKSDGLGRRGYSCRDPEGHIWNFGTYNPGRGLATTAYSPEPQSSHAEPRRHSPRTLMSLATLMMALCATCWWFSDEIRADFSRRVAGAAEAAHDAERAYAELVKVRAEKRKAEALAKSLDKDLAAERARRTALETNAGQAGDKLAQEERARRAAEATLAALRDEVKRGQRALEVAVEARRVSEEKLAVLSAAPKPEATTAKSPEVAPPQPKAEIAALPEAAQSTPASRSTTSRLPQSAKIAFLYFSPRPEPPR